MKQILGEIIKGILIIAGVVPATRQDTGPVPQKDETTIQKPSTSEADHTTAPIVYSQLDSVGKFGGTGTVYVVNVKPDSLRDMSIAIQKEIDNIPDGTYNNPSIIRFRPGKYLTNGDLKNHPRGQKGVFWIEGRKNLIFDGNGAEFFTTAPAIPFGGNVGQNNYSHRRHFWFNSSQNIVIKNLKISGSNTIRGRDLAPGAPVFWKGEKDNGSLGNAPGYQPYWEFEHGISIHNGNNFLIENVEINGMWGDGIYLGNTPTAPTTNVAIRHSFIQNTGRQAIALCNAQYILIDSVTTSLGRRAAIDLEPYSSDGFVTDVEIRNSSFQTAMTFIAALGKGDVSNIYIHHNDYTTSGHTIVCRDSDRQNPVTRKNWRFENNVRNGAFGSPIADIRFTKTDSIFIRNNINSISSRQSRIAAGFDDCNNVVLEQNDFGDAQWVNVNDELIDLEKFTKKIKQ